MTDKELLELAAKAAGHELVWEEENRWCYIPENRAPFNRRESDKDAGVIWNPLTDDGDALRLAVKLQLLVNTDATDSQATDGKGVDECELHQGSNAYAATRRAIVRAAAEIGKGMK